MASDVTLREISQDTVTQIMALKVGPDQEQLDGDERPVNRRGTLR